MVLKSEAAQRMRDAFKRILQRMCEIVHRIDAPGVPGMMMLGVYDPVQDGIAQIHVGRRHINFGPEHPAPVGKLAASHPPEQFKIFLRRAVAVRAVGSRLRERAAIISDFVRIQIADVGQSVFYELLGAFVHTGKIIRGIQNVFPGIAKPADVVHDCIYVLRIFLARICIVEAQVAVTAVLFRRSKIDADRLCMSDVQIAVRLRGETRTDGFSVVSAAFLDVVFYDFMYKVIAGFHFLPFLPFRAF